MKNLVLLFCLFAGSLAFSQDISFDNGVYVKNQTAYTGKHILYFENGAVTESHLDVKAKVPRMKADKFAECANEAKENCPISKLLSPAIPITMEASLL